MHTHPRRSLLALAACVCLTGGCTVAPVNTPAFSEKSGVRWIDPNDGPFVIESTQDLDPDTGRIETSRRTRWKPTPITPNLLKERTVAVNANAFSFWFSNKVLVPVRMPNGRQYSAVMDTGYASYVYLNDAVVRDNDLAIYPLGTNPRTNCAQGLCAIPTLNIGDIAMENVPAWYEQRQWQLRILGIPLYRQRTLLIGLELMRPFSYILFDTPGRRIVFSPLEPFQPRNADEWVTVPFALEEIDGTLRMIIPISVAGVSMRVHFDTGGGREGLTLSESLWQRVTDPLVADGRRRGKTLSYQYGSLPCRRYVVPEFFIGDIVLRDKEVVVLPENSPLLPQGSGILGLAYFKKTTVVLDFKSSRIWIRRNICHRTGL